MYLVKTTREQVQKLFDRKTVADIIPSRETLEERLCSGNPFHIYLGIDPTAKKIHLGHVQNILFLEDLRKMGAKITLLFGSFTGLVGDPAEKESTRPQLKRKQVWENMHTWKKQVNPVLNISRIKNTRIAYNHRWFKKISLEKFLGLLRETTVQHLLERDMFQKRIDSGKPLYAHEMMYPILQGYDSVALQVDAELCGTDQVFNALVGRTMVRRHIHKEKFIIAMNLIQSNGVMMSKSNGTGVFVDIEKGGNHRMFGSIMALPDGFIDPLLRGCTRIPMHEIENMRIQDGGTATRNAKIKLAREIVRMFWGENLAEVAEKSFITQFSKKGVPENTPTIFITETTSLHSIIVKHLNISRSEAKRRFTQNAVSLDGKKITDVTTTVGKSNEEYIVRVGRHIFRIRNKG